MPRIDELSPEEIAVGDRVFEKRNGEIIPFSENEMSAMDVINIVANQLSNYNMALTDKADMLREQINRDMREEYYKIGSVKVACLAPVFCTGAIEPEYVYIKITDLFGNEVARFTFNFKNGLNVISYDNKFAKYKKDLMQFILKYKADYISYIFGLQAFNREFDGNINLAFTRVENASHTFGDNEVRATYDLCTRRFEVDLVNEHDNRIAKKLYQLEPLLDEYMLERTRVKVEDIDSQIVYYLVKKQLKEMGVEGTLNLIRKNS